MTVQHRCVVCGRVLGVTLLDTTASSLRCPDRPCYLYPPVSLSRATDPTMTAYLTTVVTCTKATPHKLAMALGEASGSRIIRQAREQEKRWGQFQ